MNSYKAPNLIISPKRKKYRRGTGAGALNDDSTYTHTHILSHPPPPPQTYIYHSVGKRRPLGREKMCL